MADSGSIAHLTATLERLADELPQGERRTFAAMIRLAALGARDLRAGERAHTRAHVDGNNFCVNANLMLQHVWADRRTSDLVIYQMAVNLSASTSTPARCW
jgi:hypothetical protein